MNRRLLYLLLAAFTTILTFWACDTEDPWSPFESKAALSRTTLGWDEQSITLTTSGDARFDWSAAIVEGYEWASFSDSNEQITKKGKVGTTATIYLSTNTTTESRVATLHIKFTDGYSQIFTFEQYGVTENSFYDRNWAEQPEMIDNEDLIHKTYYTTLANGKYVRNYSICYDTEKLVSRWVAYPLHSCYVSPSLSRTNAWSFDPALPQNIQQNIVSGGYNDGGNKQLDRGHMLPSASRYSTYETNAQTFYGTNMTPQLNEHNEKIWADLESKVRGYANTSDTTYVVTGVIVSASSKKERDSYGQSVTIPDAYFKAVLKYSKSSTLGAWNAAAFYLEHRAYSGSVSKEHSMSIDELEEMTGIDFFVNLPAKVGAAQAAKIEAANPANSSVWW